MLLLKNPQFLSDHYEILTKEGTHEDLISTKFCNDWVKIGVFLIKVYFWVNFTKKNFNRQIHKTFLLNFVDWNRHIYIYHVDWNWYHFFVDWNLASYFQNLFGGWVVSPLIIPLDNRGVIVAHIFLPAFFRHVYFSINNWP